MGDAGGVLLLRGRRLSLYSLPEVAPSPVVLRGFGQACKWQMDNGRPRRPRAVHVLFMSHPPPGWGGGGGGGWLLAAMPPVAHRVRNTLCPVRRRLSPHSASKNSLWPVQKKEKKPGTFPVVYATCRGKESHDMDIRRRGQGGLLGCNPLQYPALS